MLRIFSLVLASSISMVTLPLSAQSDDAAAAGDIVVEGTTVDGDPPIKTEDDGVFGTVSRQLASEADRFSRCADMPRPSLLRRIVDGHPETGETRKALDQHIMRNQGCYGGMFLMPPYPDPPYYGKCNPHPLPDGRSICRSHYDRGAIYEQVLRKYAADLTFDRAATFDPVVRAEFMSREEERNQFRRESADYFWFAACAVQLSPEYALQMLEEEPGSEREVRYQSLMISEALPCFEGRKVTDVTVDRSQFRAFVAEAAYSWAVAVMRVDSLLPADLDWKP